MHKDVECQGRIDLGTLSPQGQAWLEDFRGQWLEYAPNEMAIVVRHVEPGGCPAISAISCELLALLDALPRDQRSTIPGGVLTLKDNQGIVMRLVVKNGEVKIQWPHPDYAYAVKVSIEKAFSSINPAEAKIDGWARFTAATERVSELQQTLDEFEGLYPEGHLHSEYHGGTMFLKLDAVNMGPQQLMERLHELTDEAASLQAELVVTSFASQAQSVGFQLHIRSGEITAFEPSLWREE